MKLAWQEKQCEIMLALGIAVLCVLVISVLMSMTGRGGGSFYVPVLVACGLPMRVAVGTSSAMVVATAFMGLVGHSAAGDFNAFSAIPMSVTALVGGLWGGVFSLKTKAKSLKRIFAYTTLGAALFMVINA